MGSQSVFAVEGQGLCWDTFVFCLRFWISISSQLASQTFTGLAAKGEHYGGHNTRPGGPHLARWPDICALEGKLGGQLLRVLDGGGSCQQVGWLDGEGLCRTESLPWVKESVTLLLGKSPMWLWATDLALTELLSSAFGCLTCLLGTGWDGKLLAAGQTVTSSCLTPSNLFLGSGHNAISSPIRWSILSHPVPSKKSGSCLHELSSSGLCVTSQGPHCTFFLPPMEGSTRGKFLPVDTPL